MNFLTAFWFFTKDETWKYKLGTASLLMGVLTLILFSPLYWSTFNSLTWNVLLLFTLIFGLCVMIGYTTDISRNVRDGEKNRLPEWSFWHQFKQGGTILLSAFIYMIPVMLLITAVSSLAVNAGISKELVPAIPGNPASVPIGLINYTLFYGLLTFFLNTIRVTYTRHNTLRSCFQFKDIGFIIRKRWDKLLLIVLLSRLISLVTIGILYTLDLDMTRLVWLIPLTLVTTILSPIIMFAEGHLCGQIASLVDLDKLKAADNIT